MQINKYISKYNQSSRYGTGVKYIVIHYVGAVSSARNNCVYFARGDRQASAHYFADDSGIWQSIEEAMSAWHCGGPLQGSGGHSLHGICTNSNSIGIEMCLKMDSKGRLYVTQETLQYTADLVQDLMRRYGLGDGSVIRHYDVTGKLCPNCYTYYDFSGTLISDTRWKDFKWYLINRKRPAALTVRYRTQGSVAIKDSKENIVGWTKRDEILEGTLDGRWLRLSAGRYVDVSPSTGVLKMYKYKVLEDMYIRSDAEWTSSGNIIKAGAEVWGVPYSNGMVRVNPGYYLPIMMGGKYMLKRISS